MANDFTVDKVSGNFRKKPQDSDWITVQQILDAKPEMIFYGSVTPWWTHNPDHLSKLKMKGKLKILDKFETTKMEVEPLGLPCDPIGGMLMQTDKIEDFLKSARPGAQGGTYGRHGLKAFEMAHHENHSTPFKDWEGYNALLDNYLEQNKIGLARLKSGFCPYCNKLLGLVDLFTTWFCESCAFQIRDELKRSLEKG